MAVADLVRLAQGFYLVFWGLLATVLMSAHLVLSLPAPAAVSEWFMAAGVIATLVGSVRLRQARSPGPLWRKRSGRVAALAGLLAYFAVLFCLWRRAPASVYLFANAVAFGVSGLLYVIAFAHATAALADVFGRVELVRESRWFGAGNVALLLPVAAAIAYAVVRMMGNGIGPVEALRLIVERTNLLVVVVLLLPFSLTLALAWACKDVVLRRLVTLDRQPTLS